MKVNYHSSRNNLSEKKSPQKIKITEKQFLSNVVKNAKTFIKDKVKSIKKNAKKIFKDIKKDFSRSKSPKQFKPGSMITFTYDAKFKDGTIWDKKPLIICLGWSQNPKYQRKNFYGLNFHHLSLKDRVYLATFFAELSEKRGGVTYKDVKPFMKKFGKSKVLRQYIYKRVSGKVIEMPTDVFLSAAAIPSEVIMRG